MSTQTSLAELIKRAEATLIAETGQSNPAIKALAAAIAGVSYGQYGYQDYLFRQMHPETCNEDWLYLHASRHNVPRILPIFATGFVKFTSLGSVVVIPKGTRMTSGDKGYETTKEQYSDEDIEVIALEAGSASNLPSGATLTLTKAISGIDPNTILSLGIEGGADIEDLENWRARVVLGFEKNQLVGKAEDYEVWAKSAHSDVNFAWVLDNTPERGMLEVYIGSRKDDPTVSSEVIKAVNNAFEENRLAGCHPTAIIPEHVPLDVEVQGIEDPNVRFDVINALSILVKNKMGKIDVLTRRPESITNTEIVVAISSVTSNFIVKSPAGEATIDRNQIHVLGTITWTPPI